MGYNSISLMDTGYFFCPYVSLTSISVVLDEEWHNRVVQQSNEVHRTTVNTDQCVIIKEPKQNINWQKEGF